MIHTNGIETISQERPEFNVTTIQAGNHSSNVNTQDPRQETQEQIISRVRKEISLQIENIMTGSNEEYLNRCKILKQEMEARLRASEKFKELQIASLRNALHQEKLQAYNDLEVVLNY